MARLYISADYHRITALQALAVDKMKLLSPISLQAFLDISDYIYEKTSSGPF